MRISLQKLSKISLQSRWLLFFLITREVKAIKEGGFGKIKEFITVKQMGTLSESAPGSIHKQ